METIRSPNKETVVQYEKAIDKQKYAGNKVDVLIYATEKSLDAYKFNILQNKQMFISQLKTQQLGKFVY